MRDLSDGHARCLRLLLLHWVVVKGLRVSQWCSTRAKFPASRFPVVLDVRRWGAPACQDMPCASGRLRVRTVRRLKAPSLRAARSTTLHQIKSNQRPALLQTPESLCSRFKSYESFCTLFQPLNPNLSDRTCDTVSDTILFRRSALLRLSLYYLLILYEVTTISQDKSRCYSC